MKKLFLVLAFFATPALAQISVTPGEAPVPATQQAQPTPKKPTVRRAEPVKSVAPEPSATPEPKKKGGFFGFFRRLFGGGEHVEKAVPSKSSPTPAVRKPASKVTPKPSATPKPTATPEPIATPKPTATPEPSATPKPTATPKPSATPKPMATPKPSATPKPTATPKPSATPKPTATPKQTPSPVSQAVPEIPVPVIRPTTVADEAQYTKIKQQALKDARVMELHEKMVSILSAHPEGGEAYKAAALEYTAALFGKMRQLDPSNAEQITRKERATQRRLDAGLPIVQ